MTDRLRLEDLRFHGRHGVTAAEREMGAWFSVDAELSLDLAPAAVSDDVAATVDYRRVAQRIVEIGTGPSVNLLERLAGMIAEALLREFPARKARIRVRKLTAPLDGVSAIPSVELTRAR